MSQGMQAASSEQQTTGKQSYPGWVRKLVPGLQRLRQEDSKWDGKSLAVWMVDGYGGGALTYIVSSPEPLTCLCCPQEPQVLRGPIGEASVGSFHPSAL